MARDIDIVIRDETVRRLQERLRAFPRGWPKAASRAINRTATKARTRITRRLKDATKLRATDIRQRMRLHRAKAARLAASLVILGTRIPLIRFGARQTGKGVTFRDVLHGGRVLAPHRFIQRMPSGHRGVFRRLHRSRLPIREHYGLPLTSVFDRTPQLAAQELEAANADLEARLVHEVDHLLESGK